MNVTVFFTDGGTTVLPVDSWSIKHGALLLNGRRMPLSRIEEVRPGVHARPEGRAA